MATSTKRAVKRSAVKAKAKVDLSKVKSDRVINAAFAEYEAAEKGPQPLLTLMSKLVHRWADSDYTDDPAYAAYLSGREAEIRMAVRRDHKGKLSERDKKGVAASQFAGVLKLAKMKGGKIMWNMITQRTTNWTNAKELASKVRGYFTAEKTKGKAPSGEWMDKTLATIKRDKAGSAGNGGASKASATTLLSRMSDAAKKFKRFAREYDMEKQFESLISTIARFELAAKTQVTSKGERTVKLKGDQVVAYEKFMAAQAKRNAA